MSSGLLALLDDIVALTKLAAVTIDDAAGQAASVTGKTAGVLIDDAAVTPRYVVGLAAERELPIVGRIALGSLKNKLIFLLPIAILLTTFAPWALTPLLMIGGLFLCFEGYEKVHGVVFPHQAEVAAHRKAALYSDAKALEDAKVAGAIRTDLILSAEIMAISLAHITEPSLVVKALVLAVIGLLVTAVVYGAVARSVMAADVGFYLCEEGGPVTRKLGRALVKGMPPFLKLLAAIGTVAMLWVGGGILVHGLDDFGIAWPEDFVHAVGTAVHGIGLGFGGVLPWLAQASVLAIFGLFAGALTALVVMPLTALYERVWLAKG